MINIKNKKNCCGCAACVQICPKQCVNFEEDGRGFRYPKVNITNCIHCGLCEKVCPTINQNEPRIPIKVYAAKNPDEEIRIKSSSGGIFTMLAELFIKSGGVVFGAAFDNEWEVKHDYTESLDGLDKFRGSKYLQSQIGDSFKQTLKFLQMGRKVLFSGTPCHISGLKKFLRKDYDNLLTVDIVCHGVPSPLVWREYLRSNLNVHIDATLLGSISNIITEVNFRDKRNGWKNYGLSIKYSDININQNLSSDKTTGESYDISRNNIFMNAFLKNLCLRPSCYCCPAKSCSSNSDITIADYWKVDKIHPEFFDDKGISLILANSEKGLRTFNNLSVSKVDSNFDDAVRGNLSIIQSAEENEYVKRFWKDFDLGDFRLLEWSKAPLSPSLLFRIKRKLIKMVNYISR